MGATIRTDVSLAQFTTLGLGGPARAFVEARDDDALIEAVRESDARGEPVLLLGGGSNLVVSDAGVDGRVVHIATKGVSVTRDRDRVLVRAAAGVVWDALVAHTVRDGLAGLECLSGIPGCVGATPIQNVGAYGQEVSDTIVALRVWDRRDGEVRALSAADCGFGYRDSVFKRESLDRYVVLEVTYALREDGAPAVRYAELSRALEGQGEPTLAAVRDTILSLRRAKGMVVDATDPDSRSAGSFFMNPLVEIGQAEDVEARARAAGVLPGDARMPRFAADGGRVKLAAGWLIERAGIVKGQRHGGAAVSSKHALALVNRDGATTAALLELAALVQQAVDRRFGVRLAPEPVFAGFATPPLR